MTITINENIWIFTNYKISCQIFPYNLRRKRFHWKSQLLKNEDDDWFVLPWLVSLDHYWSFFIDFMVLCILSKVAIEFCLCVWSYLDFMVLCMLFDLDFILWFMYYISTLINEFCIEFWCICRCGQIWTSIWVKGLDKKCVVRGVVSEVLFLSFDIFLFLFFCFF